jgi:sugar lactone lactonase YvrE
MPSEALRGKIVVLDFWTYCCINCMHILPYLKTIEEQFANEVVVIGIHSGKFDAEHDAENISQAISRYEIAHPVINDPDLVIWNRFGISIWPTLVVIDPEGNLIGPFPGEGARAAVDRAIRQLVKYHRSKGTLSEQPLHFRKAATVSDTPLRFPGKVLADADSDRLYIADSNHNRIVISTLAGNVLDTVGTGQSGSEDGGFDEAQFFRPQGMALDGASLYVADTENHLIRRVDLTNRRVEKVAGTGRQGTGRLRSRAAAKKTALSSPWDLCYQGGNLYIAMAGTHQIWIWEPKSDTVRVYAGTAVEDIRDGSLQSAAFAQPSGLCSNGEWLYVADSEGSSIRAVSLDSSKGVRTLVGTAGLAQRLFTFGDKDGKNGQALLQHPLGIACHEGMLYVADTYNNKIKRVDPLKQTSETLLGSVRGKSNNPPQFDEPGGLSIAQGKLYVADTNNHIIRVADLATGQVGTIELQGITLPKFPQPAN